MISIIGYKSLLECKASNKIIIHKIRAHGIQIHLVHVSKKNDTVSLMIVICKKSDNSELIPNTINIRNHKHEIADSFDHKNIGTKIWQQIFFYSYYFQIIVIN